MIRSRFSTSPSSVETATTTQLQDDYLVRGLFVPGEVNGTYTHEDRMLVGGALPQAGSLDLPAWDEVLGTGSHLERRELGVINVGTTGVVVVDGQEHRLEHLDGLYVGRGCSVSFAGDGAAFYFVSAMADTTHPTTKLTHADVEPVDIGAQAGASKRQLFRYAWGQDLLTCRLQFGVTVIADGSVWNTVPPHLHERRTEVYLYADLDPEARVFHFMGRPGATRHLLVADRQAVISPPWSIHAGAGTGTYAFVWAMSGENTVYTDLTPVPLSDL